MDLRDRGLHTGLVGDAEAEGAAREDRDNGEGEEEEKQISWIYQSTVLLSKLRQAVHWATNNEGGGCLLPDY